MIFDLCIIAILSLPLSLLFESSGLPSRVYRLQLFTRRVTVYRTIYIIERQFSFPPIFRYYYNMCLNRVRISYLERAISKAGIKVCASQKENTNFGPVINNYQTLVL